MKSMVRGLMTLALLTSSATAFAAPRFEESSSPEAVREPRGLTTARARFSDQAREHRLVFRGDIRDLPKPHFSAAQGQQLSGGMDRPADTGADSSSSAKGGLTNLRPHTTSGFAGAMARLKFNEARAGMERSSKSPNDSTVANKAASQQGDAAHEDGGYAKRLDRAAQAKLETRIGNDFHSAKHASERALQGPQFEKARFRAETAMQLGKGEGSRIDESGGSDSYTARIDQTPRGPQSGTHNNFFEARDRLQAQQSLASMPKMRLPAGREGLGKDPDRR